MAKSFSELQTLAIQIRDELNKKKNSAQRVGSALLDIIDNCIQNITDIKQKLSVFEHACSGFKRVSSEAQLPVTPSQEDLAKGFLVNTSLYLYVGTGGNAVNGRYFNVGDIRGPQGEPGSKGETGNTGPTGEKGEQGNSGVTGDTSDIVVINNLDGGESEEGSIKVLAAEQGKVLNKKFTELNSSTKIINLTDKITWSYTDGNKTTSVDWIGSETLIKVVPYSILYFSKIWDENINFVSIQLYDKNKLFISAYRNITREKLHFIEIEDIWYISINFHAKSSDKNNIIQKFFYYLFKVGDKSKGDNVYWTAIGDSITAGNSENTGESYATFAQLKYGDNVVLQKLGYWGHTMGTLRTAYNTISEECDIVTVNFGANDYPSNWDSLSVDDIVNKTIEDLGNTTFENLCWFIKTMKKNRPKVSIFILTPIKRGGPAFSTSLERQGQFVDMEIELCKRLGIPVIDLHNNVPIDGQDATYQLEETSNSKIQYVHPNNLGRNIIANYIVSVLNIPYH